MRYFPLRVKTKDNVAHWKINRSYHLFDTSTKQYPFSSAEFWRYSDTFRIGNWEWQLCLCKRNSNAPLLIGLDPIIDEEEDKDDPSPIMFFSITVACSKKIHKTTRAQVDLPRGELRARGRGEVRGDVHMIEMFKRDNVMWRMDDSFTGKFVVTVKFSMETTNPWAEKRKKESNKQGDLQASLGRMLSDNIYYDVTINTSDGVKIGAHRAVLATRSPVFHSMFSHDLQEKELSTINITDMSTKACQVFIKYIYGNMEQEELVKHRLELLGAADKYDVPQLKEACDESFGEDIDRKNVVEMLRTADFYRLPKLKNRCMEFLVKSGNAFDVQDEFSELVQNGDRDLVVEIFREILKEWKSCRDEINLYSIDLNTV